MKLKSTDGDLKRLRRIAGGQKQRTFKTPLGQLESFVATILGNEQCLISGRVVVEQVVFTPKHLEDLLSSHGLPLEYGLDQSIVAENALETSRLLTAALADWLDFYFEPVPKRFLLYSDHDEYTTIFAARAGPLSNLGTALKPRLRRVGLFSRG